MNNGDIELTTVQGAGKSHPQQKTKQKRETQRKTKPRKTKKLNSLPSHSSKGISNSHSTSESTSHNWRGRRVVQESQNALRNRVPNPLTLHSGWVSESAYTNHAHAARQNTLNAHGASSKSHTHNQGIADVPSHHVPYPPLFENMVISAPDTIRLMQRGKRAKSYGGGARSARKTNSGGVITTVWGAVREFGATAKDLSGGLLYWVMSGSKENNETSETSSGVYHSYQSESFQARPVSQPVRNVFGSSHSATIRNQRRRSGSQAARYSEQKIEEHQFGDINEYENITEPGQRKDMANSANAGQGMWGMFSSFYSRTSSRPSFDKKEAASLHTKVLEAAFAIYGQECKAQKMLKQELETEQKHFHNIVETVDGEESVNITSLNNVLIENSKERIQVSKGQRNKEMCKLEEQFKRAIMKWQQDLRVHGRKERHINDKLFEISEQFVDISPTVFDIISQRLGMSEINQEPTVTSSASQSYSYTPRS